MGNQGKKRLHLPERSFVRGSFEHQQRKPGLNTWVPWKISLHTVSLCKCLYLNRKQQIIIVTWLPLVSTSILIQTGLLSFRNIITSHLIFQINSRIIRNQATPHKEILQSIIMHCVATRKIVQKSLMQLCPFQTEGAKPPIFTISYESSAALISLTSWTFLVDRQFLLFFFYDRCMPTYIIFFFPILPVPRCSIKAIRIKGVIINHIIRMAISSIYVYLQWQKSRLIYSLYDRKTANTCHFLTWACQVSIFKALNHAGNFEDANSYI